MLFVLDNYDSFTYNLVQYFGELGADPVVRRNDEITVEEIAALKPERICISPGPGTPQEAGISSAIIRELGPRIPVLGVCLGHQCIGRGLRRRGGARGRLMHGKTSPILHDGRRRFRRPAEPLRGDAVSLADRAAATRAGLPGGQRRDGGGRDHGPAAQEYPDPRRAIPSRKAS